MGELTLSSMTPVAPEHFGDTILFTTDDDILEAIFCSDETFEVDVEAPGSLQLEEAPGRPSTADGEGHERPFTQAGSCADDQVRRQESGRCPRAARGCWDSPHFPLHFLSFMSSFIP